MTTLLEHLRNHEPDAVLFRSRQGPITAGTLRAAIAASTRSLADREGDFMLLCRSAALHLVGIMTAAVLGRRVIFPAHDAPDYLDEIGAARGLLLTDHERGRPNQHLLRLPEGNPDPSLPAATDPEIVFFTSGSTSAPKAVVKRLSCIEREAAYLDRLWPLPPCRVEATVSHQHIYGLLYRIAWPLLAGHTSRDEAADYWEQLTNRLDARSILVTSPVHLTRMAEDLPWNVMRPALTTSSGAPLPFEAARDAAVKLGQLPTEVLGSTETGGIAWRQQTDQETAWMPFAEVALSTDEIGRLVVDSPYIGGERPFTMGDQVAFLPDGRFRLLGRTDRVVKVGGKRVSLPRVEQALLALAEVTDAAVVDLPERKGTLGAALVLTTEGRDGLEREGTYRFSQRLRAALAARLEPVERPKVWRFPDAIPINSQSKRQVAAIRALFGPAALPPSEVIRLSETEAEIVLDLEPDLAWFRGHFPDWAILPGIAQIHISRLFAAQLWNAEPATSNLGRVKFRKLLHPGHRVHLHLRRDLDKATIRFRFECEGEPASEGVIGQS